MKSVKSLGIVFVALAIFTICGGTKVDAAKIKISKKSVTMSVGQTRKVKLKGAKKNKVLWRSTKKKVATVKKGAIKAKKVGNTVIIAKYQKKLYRCRVSVVDINQKKEQKTAEAPTYYDTGVKERESQKIVKREEQTTAKEETTTKAPTDYTKLETKCGDVSVSIGNNILTLSGNGQMQDVFADDIPWNGYKYDKVVVQEGVSYIGKNAFANQNISSLEIKGNVTIGAYAFEKCTNLAKLSIEGNAILGKGAFKGCEKLSNISLGKTTTIGAYAFDGCALALVKLPDTVKEIGAFAFNGCDIVELTIPVSASIDLNSFSTKSLSKLTVTKGDGNAWDYTPNVSKNTPWHNTEVDLDVIINADVNYIGERMFYDCVKINSLTTSTSMNVEGSSFAGTNNIPRITIKKGSVGIATYTNINSVYYPWNREATARKTVTLDNSISEIPEYMFSQSNSYLIVSFSSNVTNICSNAFAESKASIFFSGSEEEFNSITKEADWDNGAAVNLYYTN
ncbi:MAG: leucine-rich repeat domain-containing protein [Lachnospiraceae bacterium]|nr:leucine-rich repeat domain-containing protein [Lachnospiraceae bacterium]